MIIQDFQKANNLEPDGKIGRLTFGAFGMAYNLTPIQTAHFLGQCGHESAGFKLMVENLNYSAERLLAVFGKYYDVQLALKHERKPSVIANHVYGGRMGNERPNDGWAYRGRGPLGLTGRNNYQAFADAMDLPAIVDSPDLVASKYALSSALWFFRKNNIFSLCTDLGDATILKVSRAVNLGNANSSRIPNGLDDRIKKTIFFVQFIT